jgi:hypothetical protein
VRRDGRQLARIDGHAFVVAMDDVDLARSGQLLAMPLAAGEIRIAWRAAPSAEGELGEIRDGRWHTLAPLPVRVESGCLVIPVAPGQGREMIRVVGGAANSQH